MSYRPLIVHSRRGAASAVTTRETGTIMATTGQLEGTVKSLKTTQGYGFIADRATGQDYFFHKSAVQQTSPKSFENLKENDRVRFTPIDGPKGLRAIEVIAV